MKHIFTLFVLLSTVPLLHAQTETRIGANFTADLTFSNDLKPGFGLALERKLTKHSGLETGIYYRNNPVHFTTYVQVPPGGLFVFNSTVTERFLSMPVLYKFYSRIVNISAGPTFDFLLDAVQTKGAPDVVVTNYETSNSFDMGMMLKVGKQIKLANRWLLEPELRLNPLFSGARVYGGFSLGTRYVLR
ncbi:outer membrane beta-barrel protein [Phnomibacter sp. MR]|uniref:outer membrane beta-barrel protein n=1 Tax=Phnomibacter sp. MR TaxID=3042318 RepID=UPI003A809BE4